VPHDEDFVSVAAIQVNVILNPVHGEFEVLTGAWIFELGCQAVFDIHTNIAMAVKVAQHIGVNFRRSAFGAVHKRATMKKNNNWRALGVFWAKDVK
jgi:hypothetical protein